MTAEPGRIDAHHHLWSRARVEAGDYPWMPPGTLRADHLPEQLTPQLAAAGVTGTVVVQAAPRIAETRWLLAVAAASPVVRAVTGWAPLDAPDAPDVLAELAGEPALAAVRPMIHDEADPEWVLRPAVRHALRALTELGLRFEALTRPQHLEPLYRALEPVPELPVVLDHLSKPTYRWADDAGWRRWLRRFADRPGTCCKVSGLLTELEPGVAGDPRRAEETLTPYVGFVVEAFGADRVLFGSDWPVSRQCAEYVDVVTLTERLLARVGLTDTASFWHDTAVRFYGL